MRRDSQHAPYKAEQTRDVLRRATDSLDDSSLCPPFGHKKGMLKAVVVEQRIAQVRRASRLVQSRPACNTNKSSTAPNSVPIGRATKLVRGVVAQLLNCKQLHQREARTSAWCCCFSVVAWCH